MIVACVTGGIATGKSTLVSECADGHSEIAVFDCDQAVHGIMAEPEWAGRLAAEFGSDILDAEAKVSRPRLRDKVFYDPDQRRALEALLHPEVRRRCSQATAQAAASGARLFLAEVPLLYESQFDLPRNYEIMVAVSPATQRARLRATRGLGDEMAKRILAAQWPVMEKVRRAHIVIWNAGSIPCLKRQARYLRRRLGLPS
jgi:dephospho-CoA kinase